MRRFLVLVLVGLAACGSTRAGDGRLSVVATTTQLADFVANLVDPSQVAVHLILKPNVDPHDYDPSPADLTAIAEAGLVVRNGVGLETWFDRTIKAASPRGRIVTASDGIALRADDPHVWHDPTNARRMVATIAAALAEVDPAHADGYRTRAAAYDAQLAQLDADAKAAVATLTNKKLVTNHDAFGYYADHYGFEVVGAVIPSFDTQAELSSREIADLVRRIEATGVKAVFSESSLPPKTAATVASEAGVRVIDGDDALYGDSLGPAGSEGATYLQAERHNTRVIVEALR